MELTKINRNKSHYHLIIEVIGVWNIPKRFIKPDPFVAISYQGLNLLSILTILVLMINLIILLLMIHF